jgi:GAF domain-containing protein
LESLIEANEIKKASETGQTVTDTDYQSGQAILAVPIKLREEVIGVLNVRTPGKRNWTQDEIGLVQSVAERVAVSAENARLFDQTTIRAERESAVSEITSKIRSTNNPDEMIQIAINELKQILNLKDVRIVPYNPSWYGNGQKDE